MNSAILFIGNFLSRSLGTIGPSEELAQRLGETGWQVLTTSRRVQKTRRLLDMLWTVWRRAQDYDLAHVDVYSGPAFFWAEATGFLLRRLQKPFLLTLHGGNLPAFAKRWPKRVRRLLGSARAVTSPSPYLHAAMHPYCPRLQLIPNALDLARYPARQRRRPAPKLIWLRAFHSIYQPDMAPAVLSQLVKAFPDSHLTMIGPDKHDGSLPRTREVARKLNLGDRLTITGAVPKNQVPQWLAQGDIFLNTTNVDNTPVSVLEAMACGLCVVSSNVGGIPYLLEHEHDALLVPPHDPEAMAAAVRRLLTEPRLAARLSRNARQKAEQFDWSVILPQWEALFQRVVLGSRQGDRDEQIYRPVVKGKRHK